MINLVKANAATQQQLDDASTQVDVIKKQIEAQKSALGILGWTSKTRLVGGKIATITARIALRHASGLPTQAP